MAGRIKMPRPATGRPLQLLALRRLPPQLVEEVQQKRQVRGRLLAGQIIRDESASQAVPA
jgi:hypothetical protein